MWEKNIFYVKFLICFSYFEYQNNLDLAFPKNLSMGSSKRILLLVIFFVLVTRAFLKVMA